MPQDPRSEEHPQVEGDTKQLRPLDSNRNTRNFPYNMICLSELKLP